ncbi:YlxR family protein [Paenarthrobacter sp. NPDC090520]|uniref:YlxR family protein n=1 Tax=Paenarthrobacter sp. NPDC090520 TaxID=3364382 RepID=UPI003808EE32
MEPGLRPVSVRRGACAAVGHIVAELPEHGDGHAAGPVRTCIGCRKHGSRSELFRLVAQGSGSPVVVVDERRRMAGRGAWLHPNEKCLALAIKRRAFGRALAGVTEITAVERRFVSGMPLVEAPAATGKPSKPESGSEI